MRLRANPAITMSTFHSFATIKCSIPRSLAVNTAQSKKYASNEQKK